jgi:hypothetical protein
MGPGDENQQIAAIANGTVSRGSVRPQFVSGPSPISSRANVEFRVPTNDNDVMKLHIPVLSQVPGSRMCPDEIDGKKPDKKWWERD